MHYVILYLTSEIFFKRIIHLQRFTRIKISFFTSHVLPSYLFIHLFIFVQIEIEF